MKVLKSFLMVTISLLVFGCNIFGPDVTGFWLISGTGNAQMQLQQQGSQIVGLAYFQGNYEGRIYGQLQGNNIVLQIMRNYGGNTMYQGTITSDGNSMQLRTANGQTLAVFRTTAPQQPQPPQQPYY